MSTHARKLSQATGCPARFYPNMSALRLAGNPSVPDRAGKVYVKGSVWVVNVDYPRTAFVVSPATVTISNSQGAAPIVATVACAAPAGRSGTVWCDFLAQLPGPSAAAAAWDKLSATVTVNGGTCDLAARKVEEFKGLFY